MINYSIGRDVPAKQEEGNSTSNNGKLTKASSSSRQWSGLKDPRVVRVSRAFGGKDRHSKVCTIRGLRDRRVRLSVPTAIQLYDLQDRLGLNQPSKVVDWLLNAAKDEIDKLPPLPGAFLGQFPQSIVVSHEVINGQQSSFASLVGRNNMSFEKQQGLQSSPSNKGGLNINENALLKENQATAPKSAYWNLNAPSGSNCKEVARETISERSSWMKRDHDQQEDQKAVEVHKASNSSQLPSLLENVVPYSSYYQYWDPPSLSLSHLGSHGSHSIQTDQDPHNNYNVVPVPSPLVSLPPASQLLLCPSGAPPSFFPPNYLANHAAESNTKQVSHIPLMMSSSSQNILANSLEPSLYSISQPVRPFQLNLNPKVFLSQSNNTSQ